MAAVEPPVQASLDWQGSAQMMLDWDASPIIDGLYEHIAFSDKYSKEIYTMYKKLYWACLLLLQSVQVQGAGAQGE